MSLSKGAPTGATPPRGKWKRRFLAAFVFFAALIVLAPVLLARTPLRNWLLVHALPQLQGDVHIGSASLWWFSRPVFTDIEIHDGNGRVVLQVPKLEGSKSLLGLVCHPFDLGEFCLTQPVVHVVCSKDSSNVETMLAYWLQKKEVPSDSGLSLKGIAVRAALTHARIEWEDEDKVRTWTLDPLDLSVAIPRDRRTPIRLELNATVADAGHGGRVQADVSAQLVEVNGAAPRLRAEGELNAEGLPLEAVEPLLRRLEPNIKLDGRLSANLKIQPGAGQFGVPDVKIQGSISVQTLALSDSLLGPDILRLTRVEAPCRITLAGTRLSIEQLDIQSEVGKISLAGAVDLANARDTLLQPGQHVEAELNLARLADLAPNTLHLTKDTRIHSGSLSLHLRSSLRGESLLLQGDLHTSDLEGQYQGQRIIWKEPFAVVLTAHQDANATLPVFECFRCDSDFLRLEMSGSLEEWTARGNFNLGRLHQHLAGFVELGTLSVQGEGTLRAAARRNPRGGYRLESDVRLAQFSLADGARAWREDSLTMRLDLIGDMSGSYRINGGGFHILTGEDGIDLDLLAPIADVQSFHTARARLRFHGDLTRWHGRVSNLTGLLDGMSLAGNVDLDGRLCYEGETVQLEDVKIAGRAVKFQGWSLSVDEPSLDFTTSGRWLSARDTLELQHTRLSCPTVTVQAPAVTLGTDSAGAWQITAGATVQGDVARLHRCLLASAPSPPTPLPPEGGEGGKTLPSLPPQGDGGKTPPSPPRGGRGVGGEGGISGALAGRVDLRPDEGRQIVQLDLNVQNLALGSPSAPLWRESRVNLIGHGVYDALKDSLQIVQLHLDSPALSCDAAGQLGALQSDMELSLEGKLGYDLEKLEPQLRPYLGSGVKLAGRDVRPFHITGPLVAPEINTGVALTSQETTPRRADGTPLAASLPRRLHGDAGLRWLSLEALGCQVGATELRGQLTGGCVQVAPIEATLNQGKLHLEPSLRLDPLPLELTLAKGHVLDHARLTPATCASALGYALPVLAGVAQADGEISLDLQNGRLPLTDLNQADTTGWLTIHSAQVSGGPLVQELSVLLKGPATLTLAKDNVVPFRLVNGRVYHTGLELHFPELTIRTSGSVGLDGSLALTAEMPVPPKWLGSSKLAKSALGNQTVRLPIGGTLNHPKIDQRALSEASTKFVRDAAGNALKQEAEEKLKKEAEGGLRKLFRRK